MDDTNLKLFFKKLNQNAPLKDGYFYPYKPALIIAIFLNYNSNELFNKNVLINDKVLETYYNLIINDVVLYEKLIKQKSKEKLGLFIGFNNYLKKMLLSNIFSMPAKKLIIKDNNFWTINSKNNTIRINVSENKNFSNLKEIILNYAIKILKKCVPTYNNLSNFGIDAYDQYTMSSINENYENLIKSECKVRQYQHIFAKLVKDRDKKCLICCEEHPQLLQAAHIKPYVDCINDNERYNPDNGITLCANHHLLFDRHNFTFNDNWTIKISESFKKNSDSYLRFKQFEKCFGNLKNIKNNFENDFLKYRNKNYPIS